MRGMRGVCACVYVYVNASLCAHVCVHSSTRPPRKLKKTKKRSGNRLHNADKSGVNPDNTTVIVRACQGESSCVCVRVCVCVCDQVTEPEEPEEHAVVHQVGVASGVGVYVCKCMNVPEKKTLP